MTYALIMAGGIGSRFWPTSRKHKPKQFLNLIGKNTLIQQTVDRISPVIPLERIFVSTNADYTDLVREQLPDIPENNIIGEPIGRNTAPCIAFISRLIYQKEPDATLVVLPADHYINDVDHYREIINAGIEKASGGNNLLTIGIKPSRPETGYGYIQYTSNGDEQVDDITIHPVKTFAEKPDLQTATWFLDSGDFLWNSGMFIWRVDTILTEFEKHLPEIFRESQNINKGSKSEIDTFYRNTVSISIDYGIMEKSTSVYVIPADFGWSDVGSWLSVYELRDKDEDGNVIDAEQVTLHDSQNCYVQVDDGRMVSLVGLQGIGVIDTKDALLVCRLDASQDVKQIYDSLKNGNKKYL